MKRIVIKIGTGVLANATGSINYPVMAKIVAEISGIKKQGNEIIIVTSGAIGAGMAELKLGKRPKEVRMKQAAAAVGQGIIMAKYRELFSRQNITVAQILLSYDAFTDRKKSLNLRNSIETLLKMNVIPIINENDPVSIDEIGPSFGDNDKLSALVAGKMGASTLIILTTVDGIYNKDPKYRGARMIKEVHRLGKSLESLKGKANSLGTGGIQTKIEAARIAMGSGTTTIILNGRKHSIALALKGNVQGTIFHAAKR